MRTLKSMPAGIILLFICAAVDTINRPATGNLTRDEVVKIYIDDTISGNVINLDNIAIFNLISKKAITSAHWTKIN
jgi:hypothetical protein